MDRKLMTGARMDPRSPDSSTRFSVRLGKGFERISSRFGWPILLLLFILPSSMEVMPTRQRLAYNALNFCVFAFAFFLRFWCRGYAARGEFVIEGPYRHVRNPLELSCLMFYAAAMLFFKLNPVTIGFLLLFVLVWLNIRNIAIERDLYLNLGPLFLKYKERVRVWFPSFLPEINRAGASFNLAKAVSISRSEILWLIGLAVVYSVKRHLHLI